MESRKSIHLPIEARTYEEGAFCESDTDARRWKEFPNGLDERGYIVKFSKHSILMGHSLGGDSL
jgi:hypothetical protein